MQLVFLADLHLAAKVTQASFAGNVLSGTLPASLSQLSNLKVLRLNNNLIRGSMSNSIFRGCIALTELNLVSDS